MSEAISRPVPARGLMPARLLSDERLVERLALGDEHAFSILFDRYHQRIYRYCLGILGNSADAQDALQGTMLKALQSLSVERREIELKPWLFRVAHNESIDLLRRRRAAEPLDPERAVDSRQPADALAERQRLAQLLADVEELPERQRGALVMYELAGLGFEEIGAALGITAATSRQALYEARLGLRQMEEGREMNCEAVTRMLSDTDGRVRRRRGIRAHLRACGSCRAFQEDIKARRNEFAALAPLPAALVAGVRQSVLGGSGSVGPGIASSLGLGAGKVAGSAVATKAVATVTVVAALGVAAADRGLVHPGEQGLQAGRAGDGVAAREVAHPRLPSAGRVAGSERVAGSGRTVGRQAGPVPARDAARLAPLAPVTARADSGGDRGAGGRLIAPAAVPASEVGADEPDAADEAVRPTDQGHGRPAAKAHVAQEPHRAAPDHAGRAAGRARSDQVAHAVRPVAATSHPHAVGGAESHRQTPPAPPAAPTRTNTSGGPVSVPVKPEVPAPAAPSTAQGSPDTGAAMSELAGAAAHGSATPAEVQGHSPVLP